jgi:hypothetical protein
VYNKPNGCSATGALASGPDQQQQQQGLDVGCSDSHLFLDFKDRKKRKITLTNTNNSF